MICFWFLHHEWIILGEFLKEKYIYLFLFQQIYIGNKLGLSGNRIDDELLSKSSMKILEFIQKKKEKPMIFIVGKPKRGFL